MDEILSRAGSASSPDPTGQRLVSIVFANPSSPVWRDLTTNRAFLDDRSGNKWDLFFAGMSGYHWMEGERFAVKLRDSTWPEQSWSRYHNPGIFRDVEHAVVNGHRMALAGANNYDQNPWTYSGGTDLVSFLAYNGQPDWLSLVSVRLDRPGVTSWSEHLERLPRGYGIGRRIRSIVNWRLENPAPVAQGEVQGFHSPKPLTGRPNVWSGESSAMRPSSS